MVGRLLVGRSDVMSRTGMAGTKSMGGMVSAEEGDMMNLLWL